MVSNMASLRPWFHTLKGRLSKCMGSGGAGPAEQSGPDSAVRGFYLQQARDGPDAGAGWGDAQLDAKPGHQRGAADGECGGPRGVDDVAPVSPEQAFALQHFCIGLTGRLHPPRTSSPNPITLSSFTA